MAQQKNRSGELQIILQEVISMIDSLTGEKIRGDGRRREEMGGTNDQQ